MWIENPQFQRGVWASRCWSWNGGSFISSRNLTSFNFAANTFLKENFWGSLLEQEEETSRKWSAEKYLSWALTVVILEQIQIPGIVPQPRLFGVFLSWCDSGDDCKKESGLYGMGIPPCFYVASVVQTSSPPLCHLWAVLNFPLLYLALVRNFSL